MIVGDVGHEDDEFANGDERSIVAAHRLTTAAVTVTITVSKSLKMIPTVHNAERAYCCDRTPYLSVCSYDLS